MIFIYQIMQYLHFSNNRYFIKKLNFRYDKTRFLAAYLLLLSRCVLTLLEFIDIRLKASCKQIIALHFRGFLVSQKYCSTQWHLIRCWYWSLSLNAAFFLYCRSRRFINYRSMPGDSHLRFTNEIHHIFPLLPNSNVIQDYDQFVFQIYSYYPVNLSIFKMLWPKSNEIWLIILQVADRTKKKRHCALFPSPL